MKCVDVEWDPFERREGVEAVKGGCVHHYPGGDKGGGVRVGVVIVYRAVAFAERMRSCEVSG